MPGGIVGNYLIKKKHVMKYIRTLAVFFLVLWALVWLASCRQVRYVPLETVRTDSVLLWQVKRDSIFRYDSIYIHDKGDTVEVEKYRYLFVDKLRRDTLYVCRTDTIRVPYPVERELTRWQQFRLDVGGYAVCAVVVTILIVVGYMVYKLKKGG